MGLILEVKGGRLAGKQIAVPEGQKVTIGRAPDRANFAVPHDSFMSSVHFAVEYGPEGSRIKDRKSSNGTFLNGARISEASLADGDEIRSGRTVFVVRIATEQPATPIPPAAKTASPAEKPPAAPVEPPPARPAQPSPSRAAESPAGTLQVQRVDESPAAKPQPAAPPVPEPPPATPTPAAPPAAAPPAGPPLITVGSWHFAKLPEHWEPQGEFGIQRAEKDAFPSNVVATEEMLGLATLQRFVESQVAMLRQYLREPKIEASLPPAIFGAEEVTALDIRYATKDDQVIVLRRIFARKGKHVGVLTLTTLEKDLEEIRPAADGIFTGVSFQPPD